MDMPVNGRNKGRAFELSVAKALHEELGIQFSRDLRQYQAADHGDLVPDDPDFPFIVECKRYASGTGCAPQWWAQAQRAADAAGKLPCVIYKYDRRDIRCVVPFTALYAAFGSKCQSEYQAEITLEAFCWIVREMM